MPGISWLPGTREGKLLMARNWLEVLALKGTAWGVPAGVINDLTDNTNEAETSFGVVNSSEKTKTAVTQCNQNFTALVEIMTLIKTHYFLQPPLTDVDFTTLGLKIPDRNRTPKPTPTDLVSFILSTVPTNHTVIAKYRIAGSKKRGRGPYHGAEIRIWILPLDAPPPVDAEAAGWRSEVCTATPWEHTFDAGEIGKRLYIAMRWENEAVSKNHHPAKGPWSEIESIIVP